MTKSNHEYVIEDIFGGFQFRVHFYIAFIL